MNTEQYLLVVLGEEGSELSQIVSKALRFGLHEQRDLPQSNLERIQHEYNDVIACVELLKKHCGIEIHQDPTLIKRKIEKVEKYMAYSCELGVISETNSQ